MIVESSVFDISSQVHFDRLGKVNSHAATIHSSIDNAQKQLRLTVLRIPYIVALTTPKNS